MYAHIVNVPEEGYFLNTCIQNGFLGVGMVISSNSLQGLSKSCRTSYSMFADMKTIRIGDIIFVQTGGQI